MTAPATVQPDPFELLEQLRAAAEPLGLVVELRPAPKPKVDIRAQIVEALTAEWISPRDLAEKLGLADRRGLTRPLADLTAAGRIEHNGGRTKASRYRNPNASTPNDGDGEQQATPAAADRAADTPTEGTGPDDGASAPMGRDPSPGDPDDQKSAAAEGDSPDTLIEDGAYDEDDVAAEALSDLPAGSKVRVQQDLVARQLRGVDTVDARVLRSIDEDGPGSAVEIAHRLTSAGYARGDVSRSVFRLRDQGELERIDGVTHEGNYVYRRPV